MIFERIKQKINERHERFASMPMSEQLERMEQRGRLIELGLAFVIGINVTSYFITGYYALAALFAGVGGVILYMPRVFRIHMAKLRHEINFLRVVILEMIAVNHEGIVPLFFDRGICHACNQSVTVAQNGLKCLSGHMTHLTCLVREVGKSARCPSCLHNRVRTHQEN